MALQLFKLVVTSSLTETQYFYTASEDLTFDGTATVSLAATSFSDDTGAAATSFTTATTNGYYTLEISGVLQQSDLYTVTTAALTLGNAGLTASYTVAASSPITLSVTEPAITN